jgi:hypothetical protein
LDTSEEINAKLAALLAHTLENSTTMPDDSIKTITEDIHEMKHQERDHCPSNP